jgi:hypothetical protein
LHLSANDITSSPHSHSHPNRQRDRLPSLLASSPPERSSTLPPIHRSMGPTRPRNSSITKRGREQAHKKKNSRGSAAEWLRRVQNEERRPGIDRKALSVEPSTDFGKRWEDLIDAADQAASMAGDVNEDRTPVSFMFSHTLRGTISKFYHRCPNHPYLLTGVHCRLSLSSFNRKLETTKHRHFSKP